MKLNIVHFLVAIVLFGIGCTGTTPSSNDSNGDINNVGNIKLRFTELISDILHLIFDQLDLWDLVNCAEASPKLSIFTSDALRRKFKNYSLNIVTAGLNGDIFGPNGFRHQSNSKNIDAFKFETIQYLVKHLGAFMSKITIENVLIHSNESARINRLVNEYCSDTLTHLGLNGIYANTLEQFTAPFNEVEELVVTVTEKQMISKTMPPTQLFPKLRRLTANLYTRNGNDYSFIDCHFPHLTHLSLLVSDFQVQHKDQIEGVLRRNSHIESIELKRFPEAYFKVINHWLPNAKHLTLTQCDIRNETVHFQHVKFLELKEFFVRSFEKISFSQLESVRMEFMPNVLGASTEFFRRHSSLKCLHLSEYHAHTSLPLVELTAELPDLVEVTIECSTYVDVFTISRFIENHEKLTKFEFMIVNFEDRDLHFLREHFERKRWIVRDVQGKWRGLCFERDN